MTFCSWCGLGSGPRKPLDFMPFWTNSMLEKSCAKTDPQFSPVASEALGEALKRTVDLFHNEKVWRKMQRRGMKADVSWSASARKYANLYASLLGQERDEQFGD